MPTLNEVTPTTGESRLAKRPGRRARRINGDRLARIAFIGSLLVLSSGYGYLARERGLFPHEPVQQAKTGLEMMLSSVRNELPWWYTSAVPAEARAPAVPTAMAPGLTLITAVGPENSLEASVVDASGARVHHWLLDWERLWPEAPHLDETEVPKERPGTSVHGALLLEDGSLVFNFENLGMMRVDLDGSVRWRLPYRTHHSIFRDDDGNLWAPGKEIRREPTPEFPNHRPQFEEFTVLKVSPDGGIIEKFSVNALLQRNQLTGLLYQTTRNGRDTSVSGDTLHLNDVEVFSARMRPGFFRPGDIMLSLRNINTILVLDPATKRVKYLSVGRVVRQHDPDFYDGNTISIFDNNNVGARNEGIQSRIVLETAPAGSLRTVFAGTDDAPFFTDIMGKHEWLPNGNLIVIESMQGRVLELDPSGRIVWEHINETSPGIAGIVSDAIRLPVAFSPDFFAQQRAGELTAAGSR